MARPGLPFIAALLLCTGCVTNDAKTEIVSDNPFGQTAPVTVQSANSYAPASLNAAARVDQMGRRLVAANKQAGLQPLFRTIGAPQSEIFHRGASEIDITEGLVTQCATDGQLAAVLCLEMGKIVSDRETLAGPRARRLEVLPPVDVSIGSDTAAQGTADQLHRAELARFDQEHPRQPKLVTPPEPQALARTYQVKAGYPAADIDAVAPILRSAAENSTFAKQTVPPVPQQ
jgi:predicted Zn-dependent protease